MKFDDKDEMEFYLLEELKIDKIDGATKTKLEVLSNKLDKLNNMFKTYSSFIFPIKIISVLDNNKVIAVGGHSDYNYDDYFIFENVMGLKVGDYIYRDSYMNYVFKIEDGVLNSKFLDKIEKDMPGDYDDYINSSLDADKLKIGNAYFTSIKYKFFENKFAEADAFFTTQDTFNRLESILREKFGRPTYTNILSYSWYGNTIVILFYNPISNVGILSIANKKLARKADEDERKAELEKAEKDF